MTTDYMAYVDKGQFKDLFQELGWDLPPRGHHNVKVETDYGTLVATPVADQSGLKVWVCVSDRLPGASEQRAVDQAVSKESQVRLLIFTDGIHQSWRWPRRGATAATNKKLLQHSYTVGNPDQREDLARRFAHIDLPMDGHIGISEIQDRMAKAFNEEAIKRSTEASRHMEQMNQMLLDAGCSTDTASSLLVRLLFLFFGDDTQMWPEDTFQKWVLNHTTANNFHDKLTELFAVLCDEELDKAQTAGGMGQGIGKYAGSEYQNFRRIDGMYQEEVELPSFPRELREQVLTAGEFDWGKVNPDIFGAMFQQLVDPAELRKHGEHYTTEENIQKVIEPLFLDEYSQRFQNAYDDRNALIALQDELAALQFMDPACGCGNFLIQAYKHLRGLEYELIQRAEELELEEIQAKLEKPSVRNKGKLIARRDELQAGVSLQFDEQVLRKSKLSMEQFYGIEINAWPAKVATTAMLLVDHLANQAWGENVIRLPIEETPQISHTNALLVDWAEVIPKKGETVYIFGNPPFAGHKERTKQQTDDMKQVWGSNYHGYLDYVTAWFKKAAVFLDENRREGKFAFVSTNSIAQGEQVAPLWKTLNSRGWRIFFAHQTFNWRTEARGAAKVHCVIEGFSRDKNDKLKLFKYPAANSRPVEVDSVKNINGYLIDGPPIAVVPSGRPLSPTLPPVTSGSNVVDWGFLTIKKLEEYKRLARDPIISKYLRKFLGGKELINGIDRWILYLDQVSPEDVLNSPELQERLQSVREKRSQSPDSPTRAIADFPHKFLANRQPKANYLGIPQTFSENRKYATVGRLDLDVIASMKLYTSEDPDGLVFGLISSSMFLAWQKSVGGRLKSDPSFSIVLVWNTFPVPSLDGKQRAAVIRAGEGIQFARSRHPERSLAEHYNPTQMEPALLQAHNELDRVVDDLFGATELLENEEQRLEFLFSHYARMVSL